MNNTCMIAAVTGLVVVFACINNVSAVCNWDATLPCLMNISGANARPDKANLSNIVDSFEAGIRGRCNKLQTLLSCMTEATKDCQPDDDKTNRYKMTYDKMKPVVEYFCVKNVDKFIANEACMKTSALKSGMLECQKIIDQQGATCTMFSDTIKCTDTLLYKECTVIHHEVGHVLRMYIRNVMNLGSCQISEHDDDAHQHEADDDHRAHSSASSVSNRAILRTAVVFLASFIAASSF